MNQLMIFSIVLALLSVINGSLSCRFHEQNLTGVEQILVQTFKKKLLKEFGFSSVPNVSKVKVPRIPSFYKHWIEEKNTELDEDDFHAITKRLFLFPEKVVSVVNGTKKNLIFKSNPKHQTLEIKSATLWTHITDAAPTKSVETEPDHDKAQLQLYKSYEPSGNIFREKEHFHSVRLKTAGWYTIDVTGIVKEWFSVQPKPDLSLDIAVEGTKSLEIGGVSGGGESLQPFLAVETEEKQHVKERKRRADSQSCSLSGPCCRHDLVVDLSHWDFIISPRKVNIYRCAGICKLPATSLYKSKHRSRVSTLREHNTVQHNPDLERSGCCRENRIDPLHILMFDLEEQVQYKRLENVKVRSCHCVV